MCTYTFIYRCLHALSRSLALITTHAHRVIYHDALSTWWSKDAQTYLESKGFKYRQMQSLGPTNQGTRYETKLVGDSPELMPLDNNLFSDFSTALINNVCATRHLPNDDPNKFSIGTPKLTLLAMRKTWETHPTPERIAEDITRWPDSVKEVGNNNTLPA